MRRDENEKFGLVLSLVFPCFGLFLLVSTWAK